MEPVEINAGAWYLRSLRDDDRLSDVPALALLGVADAAGYVARAEAGWADESLFIWAVCIPTTGETVALIGVQQTGPESGELCGTARDGYAAALEAGAGPVSRFAAGALGLETAPLANALP
ncbi:hypothetical protein [Gordonia zhaorongruii]|uniref:hypothetical protein n=1 Tax=Gordonia zhaorongruii TaxID=2597659 RepID=UPI001048F0E2|nr:hypothetical protein [Gordonia zhaorongruii]